MRTIESQEEFDIIASQQCEMNNGNSSDDCTENWKAGYLYALKELSEYIDSQNYTSTFAFFAEMSRKFEECDRLEIISE